MQSSSAYIPSFSLSKFSETITAPYTSLAAFSSGVIDANGNLLKPESSIDPYEYFIIKLKKIFDQLPMSYTKARLSSYVSTFQMFNEEAESFGLNSSEFLFFIEGYLESGVLINEDMGTGMVSGGGAPGTLGTPQDVKNTGAVMGYDKPLEAPMFTRMPVEMFDVDDKEFKYFKNAKAWKHIPDSETKRYLKRFQQRNPSGKMAIRSNKDIHWISYPTKSFVEEYDLGFLDILNENSTVDGYNDSGDKPGDTAIATLTDQEESKKNKKGFIHTRPEVSHAEEFKTNIQALISLHRNATRPAHASEYAARLLFHIADYHAMKDTPHIGKYMDATFQQLRSSPSGNDTKTKVGDIVRPNMSGSEVSIEPIEFKTTKGTISKTFSADEIESMLKQHKDALSAWEETTPGSTQRFVYPKPRIQPEQAQKRQDQFTSVVTSLLDQEEMERIKKATEDKSTRSMVIEHPKTGRFHYTLPEKQQAKFGFKWGEGPANLGKEYGRHQPNFRMDVKIPTDSSDIFTLDQVAHDTALEHADPKDHEYLKKLMGIHL